jgi:predicted YcjX-like family ATPase
MNFLRLKTTECRVGVVGLYNAGKTVFLTSLINHLQDHDPDRFRLGDGQGQVRKFRPEPCDAGWAGFDAARYRDALVHAGRWPEKTRDRFQYVCRFERSDWTFSDTLLKLYDLPGERLADAGMLGRDFGAWSDAILSRLQSDSAYRGLCQPFLDAVAKADATEEDVLRAYRLALAGLILAFKPLVAPSTFLLDVSGTPARPMPAADLAASRFAGLSATEQFAPLPQPLRNTSFGRQFTERYDRYADQVVAPYLAALKSCHSLVVLLDLTMILAGGVGMYDDARQILADLFAVLDPGESPVETVGRHLARVFLPHDWRPGWITRVAFVAPKLDLVPPGDRDRLLTLLKRMVGRLAADRDGLKADYFTASAVVSTKSLPDGHLAGVPMRDETGTKIPPGPERRFAPSPLPDDWPRDWSAGRYSFPEVYPLVPARKDCPPDQVNLDRVFDFATDV